MASNRIKGITIEIGGDTTKLDKALKSTDSSLSTIQKNLKDVDRLLKLDPKNVELLDQKQRLLAQSSELTADRLKELKRVAEESTVSNVKYKQWQEAFTALQGEITKTSKELTKLEKEGEKLENLGFAPDSAPMQEVQQKTEALRKKMADLQQETTDTFNALGKPISIEQWDALQREISETTNEAKKAEDSLKSFSIEAEKIGGTFSNISDKAGGISQAFAPVSKAIFGIGAAAVASVPATEEFRADLSMLENNAREAGVSLDATRNIFEQFAIVSDEVDSSVEATSNLLQAGFTESNLQKAVENLAGAYLSFPDTLKIESLADSLQETLATGKATGQFAEALDRLGIGAEKFSEQLALIPDEVDRQNYALGALASKGMREVYQGWVDNNEALVENRNATLEFQQSLADLAEQIQPFLTKLTEMASAFMDWFTELPEGAQAAVVGFGLLVGAISPIAGAISAITGAATALSTGLTMLNITGAGTLAIFGKWLLIIGAVIAAVWLLVQAFNALTGRTSNVEMPEIPSVPNSYSSAGTRGSSRSLQAATAENLPHLARGTVARPNNPFLAVIGDNPQEQEIVSPYSTIKQAVMDAQAEGGGMSRPILVNVNFTGSLAQLARVLQPHITAEGRRLGQSYAT